MTLEAPEPTVDADADRAIMAFIRGSRKAHELPHVGPFALLLTDVTRLRYLNYGIPDDGADPDDTAVAALVAAFRAADRMPRVEFLPSVAPALEPALTAHGWVVEDRLPLMTCTTRTVRDLTPPKGVLLQPPSDDVMLLEMARVQHKAFGDPEPADDRTVARLRGSLNRGGHALIGIDAESRRVIGAAQAGVPAGGATEIVGVAVAESHRRRGLAAAMVAMLSRLAFQAGLTTVFLEAAPGADGAYRNAGFERTSTSVHMSLGVAPTPDPVPVSERRWPPPALRVRPFRWYWAAQWPTLLGTWMQVVALGYLVYQRTGSTTAVAAVAAADGIPSVILSLAGGVLADRLPRRRILLVTQSLLGLSAGTLAVLVATNHASFVAIIVVAIVFGATDAADLPTRQALVADLVERHLVVNAVALGATAMSATRIIGPSVAGLLIGFAGPAVCFGFLAVAYLAPIAVLLTVIPDVAPLPRPVGATAWGELVAGLRVAASDPLIRGVVIVASVLAFCGVSYMPFLPVLAKTQLHVGPEALGIMYSVGGIGGLVGGLAIASLGRGAGRLQLMLVGGVVYAASLFAVAHGAVLGITLPALVGISFAFVAVSTSMTTLLQTDTDPALRGRLLGIYATIFAGLQPLGTVAYGVLAHPVSRLFDAIGIGALLVGATTVAVVVTPSFRARVNGLSPGRAGPATAPDTLG